MTTLYEKRGRRYYPAAEMVALDSLPKGDHLIVVRPGKKSLFYNIDADHASLIAAAEDAKDAMCAAIQAALALEPQRKLTRRQRKIMDEFIKAGGFPSFSRKCAADISAAGIAALILAAARKRAMDAS